MKTTGTILFANLATGTVKTALVPATSTATLRSAINIVTTVMASATASVAFAVKRDGSRVLKFAGGTLSALYASMLNAGAIAINYGTALETSKSRTVVIGGNTIVSAPGVMASNGTVSAPTGLAGRIARALAGFDPNEHDDATPDAVQLTLTGILSALSVVDDVDWIFIDQTDTGNDGIPRIIVVGGTSSALEEVNLRDGQPESTILSAALELASADVASWPGSALIGMELVEIDLPDAPEPTTPGERLPFE